MEPTPVELDEDRSRTKIPPPITGATYTVQSLGRWVDRLMGDDRVRREAAAALAPLLAGETEMGPDPEPAQIPEPVPGGTEPIARGDAPLEERR